MKHGPLGVNSGKIAMLLLQLISIKTNIAKSFIDFEKSKQIDDFDAKVL